MKAFLPFANNCAPGCIGIVDLGASDFGAKGWDRHSNTGAYQTLESGVGINVAILGRTIDIGVYSTGVKRLVLMHVCVP